MCKPPFLSLLNRRAQDEAVFGRSGVLERPLGGSSAAPHDVFLRLPETGGETDRAARPARGQDQRPELRDTEQRGGHEAACEQRPQRTARSPAEDRQDRRRGKLDYTQYELYGTPYMGHLVRLVEI